MPKSIKKHRGRPPKEHKVINNIKHKHCSGICNKWKLLDQFGKRQASWDGKQSCCKSCKNKIQKQRDEKALEQHKKKRDEAPIGFLVCLNLRCYVKELLQPVDQFISDYVRKDEPTNRCKTCRDKQREAQKRKEALCQKVWDDWRKTHPCLVCNQNPNYKHNYLVIEADHLPECKKVKVCSRIGFWSVEGRGLAAQKAELKKCQSLCKFHHALVTQQRDHDNGRIEKKTCRLRKRAIINAEKHNRGCCSNLKCKRVLKKGEECAFHFDHRDACTKFMYNSKSMNPGNFKDLPDAIFDKQWPLEQAKCDLLCANCHALKGNRDGYRK